jgi:hypothetical protein
MKPVMKVLIVVVALCVLVTVVWFLVVKARRSGALTFKDLVRNPRLLETLTEGGNDADRAAEEAKAWSDSRIDDAVKKYVFGDDGKVASGGIFVLGADTQTFEALGPRVFPPVLRILGDAGLRKKLLRRASKDSSGTTPFHYACRLLGQRPPVEAVRLLTPFLDDPDPQVRKDAAHVLGKVGSQEAVEPLRKALSDAEANVGYYALVGIRRAIKSGSVDEVLKRELYDDVQRLFLEGKQVESAAGVLLDFDPPRATQLMLSDKVFGPDTGLVHIALEALAERKIKVPRERLLALIQKVDVPPLPHPNNVTVREALRLLGQQQVLSDHAFLEARLNHAKWYVATGAAAGLLALYGLEDFQERIWDLEEKRGPEALTVPQRLYNAVFRLDAEVNNGGFSQCFFNSSGDTWRDAIAGLEAMKSEDRLALMRQAVAMFGKEGPSEDRTLRQDQLAKIERTSEGAFKALDHRYYGSKESIDVMGARYVLQQKEAFR